METCSSARSWVPGCETTRLSALAPEFRIEVEQVLSKLKAQGYEPRVVASYRSPNRQEFIFQVGQLFEAFGASPSTRARANQSCHNALASSGEPASLAVDVVPDPGLRGAEQKARFYSAMGKIAREHHLVWGGNWARQNPTWRHYGLGWDPAHLQSRRCRH